LLTEDGKQIDSKITVNIRRKFGDHVLDYIGDLYERFDDETKLLYQKILDNPNIEDFKLFLEKSKPVVLSYTNELLEQYPLNHKVQKKEKYKIIITDDEAKEIVTFSVFIKLISPIIFGQNFKSKDELLKEMFKISVESYLDEELITKIITYIRYNVASTVYSRQMMWSYLEKVNKTVFFHILDIFNTLLKNMFILMDIRKSSNVMGYITGFINQANFYLFTLPVTEDEGKHLDPTKLKYISYYNVMKRTALHMTLDNTIIPFVSKKLQILVKEYSIDDKAYKALLEKFKIKPNSFHQRGAFVNPLVRYVGLPILERLFDCPFYYLTEYKQMRLLEGYVSLLLTSKLRMLYLGKIMRSIILDKSPRKISYNKRYIDEMYTIKHEMSDKFKERKFYFNIFNEVKNYLYHDPVLNDAYVIDSELFLNELHTFFKFFFSPAFEEFVEYVRRHNFIPPELKNTKLTISTQIAI